MDSRKIIAAAGIAGALIFTSACSASETASPAGISSPSDSAPATAAPSADPAVPVAAPVSFPDGIVAKGVANDGIGAYLQTSIADTDPAMQYNPAITDDAAKAHYSAAQLADAQKVIVRFIAEEAIDSTLNGGNADVDGWWAAHKDQIHPSNQAIMLNDLKAGKDDVAREQWIAKKTGYSYVHGADTPRVTARTITPVKFYYVETGPLQGLMLDTTAAYSMAVKGGLGHIQNSTAEISYAVAIDPADGKWKIAGYDAGFHTREG